MTSILFIWVVSAGQLQLAGTETFYTLEACQVAARAAENAPLTFVERPVDAQVRGICTLKRLSKQGER